MASLNMQCLADAEFKKAIAPEFSGEDPVSFSQISTIENYRRIMREIKRQNYLSVSIADFDCKKSHIMLRHDADISLTQTLKIAEVDAEEGFTSSIFILLSSHFYNPFTRLARSQLLEMVNLGHEVGLHFDPSIYPKNADLESVAHRECERLEDILGQKVNATAAHRPGFACPHFLGMPGLFADRLHAYAPQFFTEATYISDSAGFWSHGNPLLHPAFRETQAMQLLMHPYLWTTPGESTSAKINRVLAENAEFLTANAAENFRHYVR